MSRPTLSIALIAAAAAGWLGARTVPSVAFAADEATDTAYRCRAFRHALDGTASIDTHDRTSEIGQWVAEQRTGGWTVEEVDFEIASKSNGFPQGYVQVCLRR